MKVLNPTLSVCLFKSYTELDYRQTCISTNEILVAELFGKY